MQNDSAPAAVNFINLLFICYLLDIGVPWRDSVPLQSDTVEFGARTLSASQRPDSTLRHLVRGGLPQRVTVGGAMRDSLYHCHGRLPKIVSIPIADVFEGGSQCPMICHIVTGLRHLLFRVASMRVSQASVAEMLQTM